MCCLHTGQVGVFCVEHPLLQALQMKSVAAANRPRLAVDRLKTDPTVLGGAEGVQHTDRFHKAEKQPKRNGGWTVDRDQVPNRPPTNQFATLLRKFTSDVPSYIEVGGYIQNSMP